MTPPPTRAPDMHERLAAQAPRTWQRMLSGRKLNLINPSPMDIEIEDIALGLARNTRWNGQTSGEHGWSVAQHSVLVTQLVTQLAPKRATAALRMTALLHDASEYVTHDLITPLKAAVGDVFREVEDRLTAAVNIRFGLPGQTAPDDKKLIKRADRISAATEAVQLAGFQPEELKSVLGIPEKPLEGLVLVPLAAREAEAEFLQEFKRIDTALRLEQR